MTRVLVTGPTGYCGPSIVRGLLAEGHTTRVLARRHPTCLPATIEIAIGDLSEDIEWPSLLDDVDFIVHLAALMRLLSMRAWRV